MARISALLEETATFHTLFHDPEFEQNAFEL